MLSQSTVFSRSAAVSKQLSLEERVISLRESMLICSKLADCCQCDGVPRRSIRLGGGPAGSWVDRLTLRITSNNLPSRLPPADPTRWPGQVDVKLDSSWRLCLSCRTGPPRRPDQSIIPLRRAPQMPPCVRSYSTNTGHDFGSGATGHCWPESGVGRVRIYSAPVS